MLLLTHCRRQRVHHVGCNELLVLRACQFAQACACVCNAVQISLQCWQNMLAQMHKMTLATRVLALALKIVQALVLTFH